MRRLRVSCLYACVCQGAAGERGAARCAGRSHEHDKGKGHEDLLVLLSIVIRGRAIRTGCSVNLVSEP